MTDNNQALSVGKTAAGLGALIAVFMGLNTVIRSTVADMLDAKINGIKVEVINLRSTIDKESERLKIAIDKNEQRIQDYCGD